ncbi:rod shape-determining protein MreC [Rheinheimera muenzenbergensis]|uniref:Cell shape-determining protein MreC n=1 Tax=Rheinheimera muenzenbergensis TaxID=1193628 RepID=A0ABU8CBM2_9GAMM|nr:rod shape-determining protein MreC [Gammaproteobacteria bacterium]MBU1553293.1 rod shape-determining protein MreC [Gammaproteobacteria bacterium]MBU2070837.1 rod shape-determining protein MreC [Gammaproteobacteria bacterium]MBU2182828.1 rod shape-determining protein MreC [Gammaproteobacteria bacterium]MBU2203617.1 rod shape-determining protein MreC [Gammaproteobacteria bacterium]
MNDMYFRGPSLPLRLLLAVVCSVGLMLVDRYTDSSTQLRSYLTSAVSPLFYVASLPQTLFSGASEQFMSQQAVLEENSRLKETLLQQSGQLQLLRFLQQENDKLRALLGSAAQIPGEPLIAEVLAVYSHPFSHQVVLNKGSSDGVQEHQPLIDDQGVVGQITSLGPTSSRAILISDNTHALAVRTERTGVRAIVEGLGQWDSLRVMHLPHSTDIREGDRLLTSGLDGRFPEGYPVARVTRISQDVSQPFMVVYAEPFAQLDRIRHVLLLARRQVVTDVEPTQEQP